MSGSGSSTDVNSIFLGEVASVQNYGAFVKIPGSSNQGLVHRTQISKVNVPDVSDVLAKGDRVWCKIISTTDDGKIALSMKVVDQGSGKDLDPNGVQMKLDEQRRKEWVPGEKRKAISLDAVYNTTCSKCGTRGHLGKDCFQTAGGKTYDLIPEDDAAAPPKTINESDQLTEKDDKKKEKHEAKRLKKEAKKKKKAAKKLKKKLRKEAKKAKKRKHSSTEDSSDSSDTSSSSESECGRSRKDKNSLCKEKSRSRERGSHVRDRSRSRSRQRMKSNSVYHRDAPTPQESRRR